MKYTESEIDDIIKKANESSSFVNFNVLNKSFIIRNLQATEKKTSFDSTIYNVEILNEQTKQFEVRKCYLPVSLETRFRNLGKKLKASFSETIFLVKYNGVKESNKGREMHSYYVEILK